MWKRYKLIFSTISVLYVLVLNCDAAYFKEKQKVCVIGAGASGLTAAKQLAEHLDEFNIVVFEKNSDVGGLWIYNARTDVDEHGLPLLSPMYKYLRTNGPKELMAYIDYRHWNGNQSFVSHLEVLSYLRNFTNHFNICQYVKFNTLVEKVTTLPSTNHWKSTKYEIKTKNLNTNKSAMTTCDAVIIANGWNSEPNIPNIPGIENFSGKVIHSVAYRTPEEFAGKTIVVLGASFSGTDISFQISDYAKKIYLSHKNAKIKVPLPSNIEQVPGVIKAEGNTTFILQDGSKITADAFIFCTGFHFSAPYIDDTSGVTVYKKYIYPVYKHIINAKNPSMAFIGLPQRVLPFLSFYYEAKYFIEVLRGNIILPDEETMIKGSEVTDKQHPYAAVEDFEQIKYLNELADAANAERLPNYYIAGTGKWYSIMVNKMTTFRDYNLIILNENDAEFVHKTQRSANDLNL